MDKPDRYADLKDSLNNRNVVAFVGAGLSIGAGLPGWYQLISELAQRIGYELPPAQWATGDALIDAAQAYINEQGLNSLVMFLKDRLDTTDKSPTATHQALARLPISLALTANYDDLLERAYRDAGKRVHIVVRDNDIPFMRRGLDVVNIVKLYGDLDQPDTIVLARQQYEAFFLQRPQMIKLLETELGRSDVLYLGWSHSDPHFNLVFGELLNRFGEFMRLGYAVMFDLPEAQRKELERKKIHVVQLPASGDRTGQLAAWLNSLASGDAAQQSPRTQAPCTESKSDQLSPTVQLVPPKESDLRLLLADPSGKQLVSHLEFSIPPRDPSRKLADEVAFRLYLDNQGQTMARYVVVNMSVTSDTDPFWIYEYKSKPFLIEESPRPWQITPPKTYIECYFEGGTDFVCHSRVHQRLGLVKMLVPYGQPETTVTFHYRILAEGYKSRGSFAIALKPGSKE